MKDYLNTKEKNQFMVILSILQLLEGVRNTGVDSPKVETILKEWTQRDNMTKEEHKSLKTAETYLKKFATSVYERLDPKEQKVIRKKLTKFDFKLVDDFTLKQIYRDMSDRMVNAVLPRQQFYTWCEEIMNVKCKNCTKDWKTCELHHSFEYNFVPESSYNLKNCRYAYRK